MSATARFRFYGELNDLLAREQREIEFEHAIGATDTLKHLIESLGVPHTEIGGVQVNGKAYTLDQRPSPGDRMEVEPHTIPVLVSNARFVVDGHLGRLAAYLRMLGFDTWYRALADDAELAHVSATEHRLLLTRDAGLLKRREVSAGYFVRRAKPLEQLAEISTRFALSARSAPFTRCMHCNGLLEPVGKAEVYDLLPPHTQQTKNEFSRCLQCGKVYWRGSHHERMSGWIATLGADRRQ